jgi:predicted nucleotidyltransferase
VYLNAEIVLMNRADIKLNAEALEVLNNSPVTTLVIFGSHALGLSHEGSDYDIGVLVEDSNTLEVASQRKELYDKLYDILDDSIGRLVDIDIVFLDRAPGELQAHVMRHGKVLYEKNTSAFANFRERTMLQYADFEPYREMFQNAILEKIN